MIEPVNLRHQFSLFGDYWSPKIVGELNDSYVKVVKLKGEFVWHHHEMEDEHCLSSTAACECKFRDGDREIGPREVHRDPRGCEPLSAR